MSVFPYCTNQRNKCLYAFLSSPTDCILSYLPQHPGKPTLPQNLNIIIRLKPKQCLSKYDDMLSAANFIAQGLHLQQKLFEKNKSRKWKLEWKINKIKMTN